MSFVFCCSWIIRIAYPCFLGIGVPDENGMVIEHEYYENHSSQGGLPLTELELSLFFVFVRLGFSVELINFYLIMASLFHIQDLDRSNSGHSDSLLQRPPPSYDDAVSASPPSYAETLDRIRSGANLALSFLNHYCTQP